MHDMLSPILSIGAQEEYQEDILTSYIPSSITAASVESDLYLAGSCNALFVASSAVLYSLYADCIKPGAICLLDMTASPIALIEAIKFGDGSESSSRGIYGSPPKFVFWPIKYLKV
jgi:hypothetical protein